MKKISRIGIVVPYLGKLPNYFKSWLESCRYNPTVDWFIFTDDKSIYDYPPNVHVFYMEFKDVVKMFQDQFDFPIQIQSPYFLCDFKPAYGVVFSKYLKDFDFWGFGDIDLIYGNIRSFLTEEVLLIHDKVLVHGHFCLMKNEEVNNNVFRREFDGRLMYKEVYTDTKHRGFDEYGDESFNAICERESLEIYKNNLIFADINSWKKHFKLTYVKRVCSNNEIEVLEDEITEVNNSSVFIFNKGKLTRKYIRYGKIKEQEYMYVHFQKRKLTIEVDNVLDKFLIIPNKFINFKDDIDLDFLLKYGKKKFFSNRRLKRQIYIKIRMFIKDNFGI